jgi:short-subunit dehydrogenase
MKHRVAVVTGASSGIGASLAVLLSREPIIVVAAARRMERLRELSSRIRDEGGTCLPMRCDVTKREEAERLIETAVREYGRLDVLVNNAGRGHFSSIEETTDEMIAHMFAVNVYSLWYTTRPALRQMKRQGSGHIINVASMAGKLGFPFNGAYVAAKHACVGFTYALRSELTGTGIYASVVCPSSVLTDWASSTEGGPMRELFSKSGPVAKKIAAERGITLPGIEGVKSPDAVAEQILECIRHPVPEVFTHSGSKEMVMRAAEGIEQVELQQLPIVLGEREIYSQIKGDRSSAGGEPRIPPGPVQPST